MNQEIKKKWLERLRSGEIPQQLMWLGKDNARCCLGVLCDLAVEAGVISAPTLIVCDRIPCLQYDDRTRALPKSVIDWAELRSPDPVISLSNMPFHTSLAGQNDSGMNFNQIADLIEQQL